jgi:DNA replication protein DnaC
MLQQPTLERLRTLRLHGMADAYAEQIDKTAAEALSFDERFGLLVDREASDRENRRLTNRLRRARLREQASLEDLEFSAGRGLDKSRIRALAQCKWIKDKQNILIVGSTGTGKTYLACALTHKACLEGHTARYYRLSRLLQELGIARADGSYAKFMRDLAKTAVLVLDDWGIAPIADPGRRELLEVLDDRHGNHSTVVTSQLPVANWHETIGEATLADAILDRLVHNAHRIELKGDSMRRKLATIDNT